jgi:hypothetical protein
MLRSRLSYANVMATVAVFIALGGTSYAAITIGGKNVRNGSLTGADVKTGSLTSSDVKNRSLLARDFKNGQLPRGLPGVAGGPGLTGPVGPGGPVGLGSSGKSTASSTVVNLKPGDDWATIDELHTTTKGAGLLHFSGSIEETAVSDTTDARVRLRIVHNGHAHPVPSGGTVFAGSSDIGLVLFECNEQPGAQDVQLQAQVTGAAVDVGARSLALTEWQDLP